MALYGVPNYSQYLSTLPPPPPAPPPPPPFANFPPPPSGVYANGADVLPEGLSALGADAAGASAAATPTGLLSHLPFASNPVVRQLGPVAITVPLGNSLIGSVGQHFGSSPEAIRMGQAAFTGGNIGARFGGPVGAGVGTVAGLAAQAAPTYYGGRPVTDVTTPQVSGFDLPSVADVANRAINPSMPGIGWAFGKLSEATGGQGNEGPVGMLARSPLGSYLGLKGNDQAPQGPTPQQQNDARSDAIAATNLSADGRQALSQQFDQYAQALMASPDMGGKGMDANTAHKAAMQYFFGKSFDPNGNLQLSRAEQMRAQELADQKNAAAQQSTAASAQATKDAQTQEQAQRAVAMQGLIAKLAPDLLGSSANDPTMKAYLSSLPNILAMTAYTNENQKAAEQATQNQYDLQKVALQNQTERQRLDLEHQYRMEELKSKAGG